MGGFKHEYSLRTLCRKVLDVLTLVQNDVVEFLSTKRFDVVAHDGIGRENELVLHGFLYVPGVAIIGVGAQLGSKACQFILPVKEQAAWHHKQGGFALLWVDEA